MAGGGGIESSNKVYPGRLTCTVITACVIAATGGLIFGYDIGISGGVTSMSPFLKEFFPSVYEKEVHDTWTTNGYCKFNSPVLTFFTSSLYLAALLASFLASTVTRTLGRKSSMLGGGFLFCAGAILNGLAINVAMLIIGRVLLGFGIGFANQSVPLYLSEMAPSKSRGMLNVMFQMSITIGILFANLLNYLFANLKGGYGWRLSLGCAVIPALIFILGSVFVADTPNSMIARGKDEQAKERLKKIRGVDNVDEEFQDLKAASVEAKKIKHPWWNLMKRKYRPQLTMAILIPFFQQFTGMNVIMFYSPVLFKTIGFGSNASLMSALITGGVNFISTFFAVFLVDKCGRRKLLMLGGGTMFLMQVIIAVAIGLKFGVTGNPGHLSKYYAGVVVAFICVFVNAFAYSWGPLGWLVPSEIFPLEIRSAGQSVTVSVNMLFTFVIAEIFLPLLCIAKYGLFIFFAIFVLLMNLFIFFFLPETKGIPIDEMSGVWRKHWYWKRYVPGDDGADFAQVKTEIEIVKGNHK